MGSIAVTEVAIGNCVNIYGYDIHSLLIAPARAFEFYFYCYDNRLKWMYIIMYKMHSWFLVAQHYVTPCLTIPKWLVNRHALHDDALVGSTYSLCTMTWV